MYSVASVRQLKISDRAPQARAAADARHEFRVALMQGLGESHVPLLASVGTACRAFDISPVRSRWERYREALAREEVPTLNITSLVELERGQKWVVVFDPEDLSVEQLERLSEVEPSSSEAPIALIALCSQSTSPAKLWRVFQTGAYLSQRTLAPSGLARLCRLAAQGARPPLMRFSEQAGFSDAEQRAFFAECAGLSKCEAADELGCSQRTLETYWSRIFAKLRIRSTDGVVAAALRFAMLETAMLEPAAREA